MNYTQYINSDEWKKTRDNFLEKNPYCQSKLHIKYGVEATEVNHLTYENMGHENEEDLQALCSECHKKIHTNFSFDKNRTIEIGAINEMLSFYYNSRKNKDGSWYLFANKISDEFYDGKKLLNVFDNNTSNFFFQNVMQDILNKNKIDELYHLFETEIKMVKSYSKSYKKEEEVENKKDVVEQEVVNEVKKEDFDKDRKYNFAEFLSLSAEEKDYIESHYYMDEDYDPNIDYQIDIKDYSLSKLKSFINTEYMTVFYNCSVYFNREGISTQSTVNWFIKNKCSNYLPYLILKNM